MKENLLELTGWEITESGIIINCYTPNTQYEESDEIIINISHDKFEKWLDYNDLLEFHSYDYLIDKNTSFIDMGETLKEYINEEYNKYIKKRS